uniref:Uncharacterized protein n=1 Tax=Fagus sylvatica TaxID=28930 RepID=A0A2N9GEV1_FAGSY
MVVKFNMLFVPVVISVLFLLGLLALEASCMVLPQEKPNMMKKKQLFRLVLQVQAQVPKPNPRTTGDISRLLCRQLLKGRVPLSAPNPAHNPAQALAGNLLIKEIVVESRSVVASRFVTLDVLRGGALGLRRWSLSLWACADLCGLRGRLGSLQWTCVVPCLCIDISLSYPSRWLEMVAWAS